MRRYRLLLWLLAPALVLYTIWIAWRHRDLRYLRQRLGFANPQKLSGAIWIHAASVGEVSAVATLARRLAQRSAPRPVVVSTVTPTGAALAHQRIGDCSTHHYLPLDWPWAVRWFVRRLRPACLLVMETELWPNLYHACADAGVPIILINGRLSVRSLPTSRWWRSLQSQMLAPVRAVLARSQADAETFIALGVEPGRVRALGNIKFALTDAAPVPIDLGRRYVLAASTRDDEEAGIVRQWRASQHGGRLLVLAPRHPRRSNEILAALAPLHIKVAVRSRGDTPDTGTEVYLADTLGELRGFMAGADLVVMGGSFAPVGGHNILEPAQLGRAVIFGPHMKNFAEEAELLCTHDAAIQLGSIDALGESLTRLLAQPERLAVMGGNGARLVAARAKVLEDYLVALAELCPELGGSA